MNESQLIRSLIHKEIKKVIVEDGIVNAGSSQLTVLLQNFPKNIKATFILVEACKSLKENEIRVITSNDPEGFRSEAFLEKAIHKTQDIYKNRNDDISVRDLFTDFFGEIEKEGGMFKGKKLFELILLRNRLRQKQEGLKGPG